MTPDQVEAALVRAAAIALLGERAARVDRRKSAAVLAWLQLITDTGQRRATAMRIIPSPQTGEQHRWSHIADTMRLDEQTVRAWHAAGIAQIAASLSAPSPAKETTMDTKPTPTTRVTVNGMPLAEWEAMQRGIDRPMVTQTGDDSVRRIVARGQQLEWQGAVHQAGAVVHLPAARANELTRKGIVVRPDDFEQTAPRPVTVTQGGHMAPSFQGPRYDGDNR